MACFRGDSRAFRMKPHCPQPPRSVRGHWSQRTVLHVQTSWKSEVGDVGSTSRSLFLASVSSYPGTSLLSPARPSNYRSNYFTQKPTQTRFAPIPPEGQWGAGFFQSPSRQRGNGYGNVQPQTKQSPPPSVHRQPAVLTGGATTDGSQGEGAGVRAGGW